MYKTIGATKKLVRLFNGLFHCYPYRDMERKFPGGVTGTFSKGFKDQNYLSKGVRANFPEGSHQVFQRDHTSQEKPSNWATPGKLFSYRATFGIMPWNSSPKVNLENCVTYPCMGKKWNSPIVNNSLHCFLTIGYSI